MIEKYPIEREEYYELVKDANRFKDFLVENPKVLVRIARYIKNAVDDIGLNLEAGKYLKDLIELIEEGQYTREDGKKFVDSLDITNVFVKARYGLCSLRFYAKCGYYELDNAIHMRLTDDKLVLDESCVIRLPVILAVTGYSENRQLNLEDYTTIEELKRLPEEVFKEITNW